MGGGGQKQGARDLTFRPLDVIYNVARTQPRRIAEAVQITKLGGQKKVTRRQDSEKTECKEI